MSIKYNAPVILTFAFICSAILSLDKGMGGTVMGYFQVGTSVNFADPLVPSYNDVYGKTALNFSAGISYSIF